MTAGDAFGLGFYGAAGVLTAWTCYQFLVFIFQKLVWELK